MSNKKDRGVVIVGAGHNAGMEAAKHIIGKMDEPPLVISDVNALDKFKKEFSKSKVSIEFEPPTFKTPEEERIFMEQTKPIPLDKLPKMPDDVRTIGDYVREYKLIQLKKSKLSGSQRIVIKNVVHFELRSGRLVLTPNN